MLPVEIVKIKGKDGSWECLFFNSSDSACSIYDFRPTECRALKCWDTSEVQSLFLKDTLSRRDILGISSPLYEVILAYEHTFDARLILTLVEADSREADVDLERLAEHDERFRRQVCEKMGVRAEDLEFLFGRTIKTLVDAFKSHYGQTKSGSRPAKGSGGGK